MAIFTSPLGDFRKTLGNTVMLINDGVNIVRKKASQVKDRKSSSQLQQRAKFTTLTQTAKTLQRTLKLGYTSLDVLTGPRAQFVKENTGCVTVSAENVCTIDYSKLIVSKGMLAKVGMSATLLATVATSMFMKKKFAKKTHIVCGVALCGFALWHHMLYDKPKQKRVVHVQDEKIEAKV